MPKSITVKDLSAAVNHAVKLVAEKNKVQFTPEFHIGPGLIMGKMPVQKFTEIAQAEKFASEIAGHMKAAGGALAGVAANLEPTVLIRGGHIICGFIAPEALSLEER